MTTPIIIILIIMILIYGISLYNKMVKNKNRVQEAWSGIDVFLKKRYDLIPNLVNTVKGYASHEKETLAEIVRLRNQAMSTSGISLDKMKNESELTGMLNRLLVTVERYPDLKANSNFAMLQNQLTDIENDLEKSRRYYNGTVRDNNICIESFPSNIVANIGGFKIQPFFNIDEESRINPSVSF